MKKKTTKHALLLSFVSLFLCITMLVGTTYAWFTDSVTSKNNIIKAGNLDVELYYQVDEQSGWTKVNATTNVFMANTLWEPGHTEVVKLKIANEGTLALKYNLGVNVVGETASVNQTGEAFWLSDYIRYGVVHGAIDGTRDQAVAAVENYATTLKSAYNSGIVELAAGDHAIVTMVVYMPASVGNEANHAKGAAQPTINLGLNLLATQLNSESDSFDSDYDKDASWVTRPVDVPVDDIILTGNGVQATLPKSLIASLPEDVIRIGLSVSDPVVDTTNKTVTFDKIELVDQDGTPIDVSGLDMDDEILVTFSVGDQFAEDEPVMVYHDGTYMAYVRVDANGMISYPANHFCEVKVSAIDANIVTGSGTWGGIDWVQTKDGLLVISPTKGEPVPDKNAPGKRTYEVGEWREAVVYKKNGSASAIGGYPYDTKAVKRLVIEEGVTYIGSFAAQFPNLAGEVVIPSTVTYIGQEAFFVGNDNTTQNITKLTFAAGGTEGICIANGAFKSLEITEIAFPGDREYIHVHHWAFGGCPNLKTAYIPDNITKIWGGEHVDYFDNFNSQSNVTWANYGSMFTGCAKMETIIFENETARDLFFAGRQSSEKDYIMAYIGTTGYTLQGALDAAKENDEIVVVNANFILQEELTFPMDKNITLNLNGKTLYLGKAGYPVDTIPGNITVKK